MDIVLITGCCIQQQSVDIIHQHLTDNGQQIIILATV